MAAKKASKKAAKKAVGNKLFKKNAPLLKKGEKIKIGKGVEYTVTAEDVKGQDQKKKTGKKDKSIKHGDGLRAQHDLLFPEKGNAKKGDRDWIEALSPGGKVIEASHKSQALVIQPKQSGQITICKSLRCMSCANRADGVYDSSTGKNEIYCGLELRLEGVTVADDESMPCEGYKLLQGSNIKPGTVEIGYGPGPYVGGTERPQAFAEQPVPHMFSGGTLIRVKDSKSKSSEDEYLPLTPGFAEHYNVLAQQMIDDLETEIATLRANLIERLQKSRQEITSNPAGAVEIGAAMVLGIIGSSDDEIDDGEEETDLSDIIIDEVGEEEDFDDDEDESEDEELWDDEDD